MVSYKDCDIHYRWNTLIANYIQFNVIIKNFNSTVTRTCFIVSDGTLEELKNGNILITKQN